jgi:hypothetical protein
VCDDHFVGDGVLRCEAILPKILDIRPLFGYSEDATEVNITFVYDEPEVPKTAFCRFGLASVTAASVTKGLIRCVAPTGPPQSLKVAISFDGTHWSVEHFSFVTVRKFHITDWIPIGSAYFGIVALLVVFAVSAFRGKKEEPKGDEEERVPFLNQGQNDAKGRKRRGARKRNEP